MIHHLHTIPSAHPNKTIRLFKYPKSRTQLQMLVRMRRSRLAFIAGGNAQMEQPFWNTVWQVLTEVNVLLPNNSANILVFTQKS